MKVKTERLYKVCAHRSAIIRRATVIALSVAVISCTPRQTLAIDFGKRAATFTIKEEGFIAMILRKLEAVDMEASKRKMQETARQRIEHPAPVEGIMPAVRNREFYWDPTYTLDEDAVLPCGKVLHRAGTKVNPLEHMNLERRLYFIDARQAAQIEWLKEELSRIGRNDQAAENRIILVAGSVLKLREELGQEVYFDQSGELTGRMGIKASPAVAEQEGGLVKINEVVIDN